MRADKPNQNAVRLSREIKQGFSLPIFLLVCSLVCVGAFTSGCPVAQEPECEKYIDCMAHYSDVFERDDPVLSDYEENGTCWQDAQTAELCKNNCIEATNDLNDALELAKEDLGPCA